MQPRTKLHALMEEHGIGDAQLSAASGVSPRHISYVKSGEKEPSRFVMAAILAAMRELVGRRSIKIHDLFSFDDPRQSRRVA